MSSFDWQEWRYKAAKRMAQLGRPDLAPRMAEFDDDGVMISSDESLSKWCARLDGVLNREVLREAMGATNSPAKPFIEAAKEVLPTRHISDCVATPEREPGQDDESILPEGYAA